VTVLERARKKGVIEVPLWSRFVREFFSHRGGFSIPVVFCMVKFLTLDGRTTGIFFSCFIMFNFLKSFMLLSYTVESSCLFSRKVKL